MSNLENLINNQEEQYEYNNEDDFDFDFENLEMPQLVRRNGAIQQENVQGYIILGNMIDKMFKEEACPICLSEDEELYPLFCGHTFCQNDINNLLTDSQSKQNVVCCPICRQYQFIESFKKLQELKIASINTIQKDNNVTC
ncbi:unnamed protein product (macronuclear) [Paramecium tetraurelia]|uniref:RING-type domain-containing protein n=1 Tax=Paramecium tetraurelia TaxID=5888 RepID=A0CXU5_PARTE|nr:uncharacterized protein GSPATT00011244001 [Paramecium tetraurelia]CAK75612.1 unnamed protein product [Paramecium tetraurelia]|eukprot:XP_001443009.1 hypothetical protein (macronuclear) [Paramecium tetraurelia strain d4-2]